MVIVSKSNPLVKELVSLKEKKGRQKSETFLVEGIKMVRECVAGGMQIVRLVVREDYAGETYALPTVTLGVDAFSAVSNEKTPQGMLMCSVAYFTLCSGVVRSRMTPLV